MTEHTTVEQSGRLLTPDEIRNELLHLSVHVQGALKVTDTRAHLARCFVGNDAVVMAALLEKVAASLGSAASTLVAIDRLSLQVATERTFDH
jgi:hypothetical protein